MITILIEITGKKPPQVAMELMSMALCLQNKTGSGIEAIFFGGKAQEGGRCFADASGVRSRGLLLQEGSPPGMTVAAALARVFKTRTPTYLLMPHTPLFMEIAPILSVELGLPLLPGVAGFDVEQGTIHRTAGGGKSLLHAAIPENGVITLQPGAFASAPEASTPGHATFEVVAQPPCPVRPLSTHTQPQGTSDLPTARVVVSAGRGVETPEALALFNAFAATIPGAARGCSRPLVDMGLFPYACQVGITGASLLADIYIAVGISGSTQHLAGIPKSTTVVSINRDPNAAIHDVSDLIIETELTPFLKATLALLGDGA